MTEQQQWYNNKELYEMFINLQKQMNELSGEMKVTQTMIRDYNGLRQRIDVCEQRLDRGEGENKGSEKTTRFAWDKFGYIVGALGVVVAILALVVK